MTGIISFASAFVAGRNLVPRPATGNTAFRTLAVTVPPRRSESRSLPPAVPERGPFPDPARRTRCLAVHRWPHRRHPRPTQVYSNPSERIGPGS